jgi:dipeptidase E
MGRLLLLSLGMGALADFVGRPPATVSVAFVPTGGDPYDDASFIDRDRRLLLESGYNVTDLDLKGQTPSTLEAALLDVDLLFVAGGNTFYLLHWAMESGLDRVLPAALDRGLLYVGASAGAIIVGPDVEPVIELDDPQAAPELSSYRGLGIVDVVVLPHFGDEKYLATYEGIIDRFRDTYTVIPLRNDEAVIIDGETHRVVPSP